MPLKRVITAGTEKVMVDETLIANPEAISSFALELVGLALSSQSHQVVELAFITDGTLVDEEEMPLVGLYIPEERRILVDIANILTESVRRTRQGEWYKVNVGFMYYSIFLATLLHETFHAASDLMQDPVYLHNKTEHERLANRWARKMTGQLALEQRFDMPPVLHEPVVGPLLTSIMEEAIDGDADETQWFEAQDSLMTHNCMFEDNDGAIYSFTDMVKTTLKPDGTAAMDFIKDDDVPTKSIVPEMAKEADKYEEPLVESKQVMPVPVMMSHHDTMHKFLDIMKAIPEEGKSVQDTMLVIGHAIDRGFVDAKPEADASKYVITLVTQISEVRQSIAPEDGDALLYHLTEQLTKDCRTTPPDEENKTEEVIDVEHKVVENTTTTIPVEIDGMEEGDDGMLYEIHEPPEHMKESVDDDMPSMPIHQIEEEIKVSPEVSTETVAENTPSAIPDAAVIPAGETVMPIGQDVHVPLQAPPTGAIESHGLSTAAVQQAMFEAYRRMQRHMFSVCDWHPNTDLPFHNPYAIITEPCDLSMIPNIEKILVKYDYTLQDGTKAEGVDFNGALQGSITDKGNILYCRCGNVLLSDRGITPRNQFNEALKSIQCACGQTGIGNSLYALPKYTVYLNLGTGVVAKRIVLAVNIHTKSNMAKNARQHQCCWIMNGDVDQNADFYTRFPFKVIDGNVAMTKG